MTTPPTHESTSDEPRVNVVAVHNIGDRGRLFRAGSFIAGMPKSIAEDLLRRGSVRKLTKEERANMPAVPGSAAAASATTTSTSDGESDEDSDE